MYNAKYIIPGVLIAVAAFTSPFWLNLGGKTYVYPEVALPTGEGKDKCIESKEWMRAEHMALLNTWRDEAIREGKREYVATDGGKRVISLQDTCMACPRNREQGQRPPGGHRARQGQLHQRT